MASPIAVPPPGRGRLRQRRTNRRAIVRLDRAQHVHAAGKTVDADLDREVWPPRNERVGGVEHRLERLLRHDVLRTRVAGRFLLHRSGGVDEDRDGGAESFFDFGLVRCVGLLRLLSGGGRPLAPWRRLAGPAAVSTSTAIVTARNCRAIERFCIATGGEFIVAVGSIKHRVKHVDDGGHDALEPRGASSDVHCGQRVALSGMRERQNGQSRALRVGGAGAGVFSRLI